MSVRMWRGKRYASLAVLRRLRPAGLAVVVEGTFWEPIPSCYWHRSEREARDRVRRLRAHARSAYLVRYGLEGVTNDA